MNLEENIEKIKKKNKNVFISTANQYIFTPQKEFFGLTEDDFLELEKSEKKYEEERQKENEKIEQHNKLVSSMWLDYEDKMKACPVWYFN